MDVLAEKVRTQLKKDGTYASGKTANSIQAKVTDTTGYLYSNSLYKGEGTVLDAIDKGVKPKTMPNISFIIAWMKDRGIQPRKKGRFTKATTSSYRRSAFGIAQSIRDKGTIKKFGHKGSGILDFSFKLIEKPFIENVLGAYAEDVQDYLDNNIGRDKVK